MLDKGIFNLRKIKGASCPSVFFCCP